MPIPFLVPIAIAIASGAAATAGVGSGASAVHKNNKAQSIKAASQAQYDFASENTDFAARRSNKGLEELGKKKLDILDGSIDRFMKAFGQIHNVKFDGALGDFNGCCIDEQELIEMQKMSSLATSVLGGIVGGAGAGALAAFGAYSATMTFATASTGTAIATLSGAAATNATLAFLGGGALAAGGGGIALGTTVLGGAVAGPAIAVLGIVMNATASKNLDNAYSDKAKTHEAIEGLKLVETLCNSIYARTKLFSALLVNLDMYLERAVNELERIINTCGNDYAAYNEQDQAAVAMSVSLAKTIKKVLDTPILDEGGALTKESESVYKEVDEFVKSNSVLCPENTMVVVEEETSTQEVILDQTSTPKQEKDVMEDFHKYNMDLSSECYESKCVEEKTIYLIERFLHKEQVSGKRKDECGKAKLEKMLTSFKTQEYGETIDNIVGLYDPSPLDALDEKISGILFMKDKLYLKRRSDEESIPIRYRNIEFVSEPGFSSMTMYLKIGNPIVFKGISFSTRELQSLFLKLAEIHK